MANEKELQLDVEEGAPSGGKKKLIIIIVSVLLLVGIGVGVTLLLLGGDDSPEEMAEGEEAEAEMETTAASKGPAMYIKFKPQFIVNYQVNKRQRYLQVHMEAMTRDSEVASALDMHSPMIRSAINNILSSQEFAYIRTAEGRTGIQQAILDEVNRIVMVETSVENGVEKILFTNFVIQ